MPAAFRRAPEHSVETGSDIPEGGISAGTIRSLRDPRDLGRDTRISAEVALIARVIRGPPKEAPHNLRDPRNLGRDTPMAT